MARSCHCRGPGPGPSIRVAERGVGDFWVAVTALSRRQSLQRWFHKIWLEEQGQDIAEYAVMLAVILIIVVGTVRLIGGNANNAFSATASSISQ